MPSRYNSPFAHARRFCSACGNDPDRACESCVRRFVARAVNDYVENSVIPRLVEGLKKNPKGREAFKAGPRAALGYVIDLLRGVGETPKQPMPIAPTLEEDLAKLAELINQPSKVVPDVVTCNHPEPHLGCPVCMAASGLTLE